MLHAKDSFNVNEEVSIYTYILYKSDRDQLLDALIYNPAMYGHSYYNNYIVYNANC